VLPRRACCAPVRSSTNRRPGYRIFKCRGPPPTDQYGTRHRLFRESCSNGSNRPLLFVLDFALFLSRQSGPAFSQPTLCGRNQVFARIHHAKKFVVPHMRPAEIPHETFPMILESTQAAGFSSLRQARCTDGHSPARSPHVMPRAPVANIRAGVNTCAARLFSRYSTPISWRAHQAGRGPIGRASGGVTHPARTDSAPKRRQDPAFRVRIRNGARIREGKPGRSRMAQRDLNLARPCRRFRTRSVDRVGNKISRPRRRWQFDAIRQKRLDEPIEGRSRRTPPARP